MLSNRQRNTRSSRQPAPRVSSVHHKSANENQNIVRTQAFWFVSVLFGSLCWISFQNAEIWAQRAIFSCSLTLPSLGIGLAEEGGIILWHVHCLMYNQHLPGVFDPVVHGGRLIPLGAQESLEGSVAGEKRAPWGCTRRTKGCRAKHPQCHTSVREEDGKVNTAAEKLYDESFSSGVCRTCSL